MKWINLKSNKCPKCGDEFSKFDAENLYCGNCGFMISQKRCREIVSGLVDRDYHEEKHYRPDDEVPEY